MPPDALDPSAAPAHDAVHPTERQRAVRASLLGAVLGVILAIVARRRSPRYSR